MTSRSRIGRIVDDAHSTDDEPIGSKDWLAAQTPEDRAFFLRHGVPRQRDRPRIVTVDGPSYIDGRCGISHEADQFFTLLSRAGGRADLRNFPGLRRRMHPNDLRPLFRELEHFGLVTCEDTVVTITPGLENVMLAGPRFRRWS